MSAEPATDPPAASAPSGSSGDAAPHTQAAASNDAEPDAKHEGADLVTRPEAGLETHYVVRRATANVGNVTLGHTEYRWREDSSRVAFTASPFSLSTGTDSPTVASAMVDIAQSRHWRGLQVSGSEAFMRAVWFEASVRGIKAHGYEPSPADLERLHRERRLRQAGRVHGIGPTGDDGAAAPPTTVETPANLGGDRQAVVTTIDGVRAAQRPPETRSPGVLAAVTEKLERRAADLPSPETGPSRDRAAPAPSR